MAASVHSFEIVPHSAWSSCMHKAFGNLKCFVTSATANGLQACHRNISFFLLALCLTTAHYLRGT
jgi:hypothetical protein